MSGKTTEDKSMATEVARRLRREGYYAEVHTSSEISWLYCVRVTFGNGRSTDIDLYLAFISEGRRLGDEADRVAKLQPAAMSFTAVKP